MAAMLGLVLDCADPDKLAEFWSAAAQSCVPCSAWKPEHSRSSDSMVSPAFA